MVCRCSSEAEQHFCKVKVGIAKFPIGSSFCKIMRPAFYSDPLYKQKQAEITRKYWKLGTFNSLLVPVEKRKCINKSCNEIFKVKPYEPKKFCSKNCAASINNLGRHQSIETRRKISAAIKALPPGYYQRLHLIKKPRITLICNNPACQKKFEVLPYKAKIRKYCSNDCVMQIVGKMTTSPKAAKSKPGIRGDISPNICFYSTWEANIARVFNLLGIKWEYAPKIFNLGAHTYRPDFYLSDDNKFIEVKNFMGEYSLMRDREFRKRFPNIKLDVISKEEYKQIEEQYKSLIDEWE